MGELSLAKGDLVAAEASFATMQRIARDRSDNSAMRRALGARAQVAERKGDFGTAIKSLEESHSLATEALEKALSGWQLRIVLATAGDRDRAVAQMRQSMEHFASINHEGLDDMKATVRRVEDSAK